MNHDYSFEQFQKRREEIRNKNAKTKKRLLSLFVTTFSIVLFSFLFIATIISPNLNIPALNNDSNIEEVGSSDFKSQGRVDYRLKEIQSDDTTPGTKSKLQTVLDSAQNSLIKVDLSELSTFGTPQMPEKTQPTQTKSKMLTEHQQALQKSYDTDTNSQQPVPYVPKAQKPSSYKILVGEYSSPEEARQMVELFSQNSDSPVRPFVKSTNGGYAVQVGSYSELPKAQSTASSYKSRNFKVKIIED
ncbi:MAG: SPOR domain-containing protein [Candidatus Gastranaerophilales bacterium]|nr:SPOR domain-containing protein [Candidatus Gastranaerophilales bacterium]